MWGHSDLSTKGSEDTRMWRHRDLGTWARRDIGAQDPQPRGCAGSAAGTDRHPVRPSGAAAHLGHSMAAPGPLPHGGERRFLPANRSCPGTAPGPQGGHAPPAATTQGRAPACRAPRQQGHPWCWHSMAQLGTPRLELARCWCHCPQMLPGQRVCPLGAAPWAGLGNQPLQVGAMEEEPWQCREAEAGCRSPGRSPGRPDSLFALRGPGQELWGDPRAPEHCVCRGVLGTLPWRHQPAQGGVRTTPQPGSAASQAARFPTTPPQPQGTPSNPRRPRGSPFNP